MRGWNRHLHRKRTSAPANYRGEAREPTESASLNGKPEQTGKLTLGERPTERGDPTRYGSHDLVPPLGQRVAGRFVRIARQHLSDDVTVLGIARDRNESQFHHLSTRHLLGDHHGYPGGSSLGGEPDVEDPDTGNQQWGGYVRTGVRTVVCQRVARVKRTPDPSTLLLEKAPLITKVMFPVQIIPGVGTIVPYMVHGIALSISRYAIWRAYSKPLPIPKIP